MRHLCNKSQNQSTSSYGSSLYYLSLLLFMVICGFVGLSSLYFSQIRWKDEKPSRVKPPISNTGMNAEPAASQVKESLKNWQHVLAQHSIHILCSFTGKLF